MNRVERYLLDTSALIDLSHRREPASSRIVGLLQAGHEVGTCAVTVAEFSSGVPPADRGPAAALFRNFRYWNIDAEGAAKAGAYRQEYARRGVAISTPDALIAATAVAFDAILERAMNVAEGLAAMEPQFGRQEVSLAVISARPRSTAGARLRPSLRSGLSAASAASETTEPSPEVHNTP